MPIFRAKLKFITFAQRPQQTLEHSSKTKSAPSRKKEIPLTKCKKILKNEKKLPEDHFKIEEREDNM